MGCYGRFRVARGLPLRFRLGSALKLKCNNLRLRERLLILVNKLNISPILSHLLLLLNNPLLLLIETPRSDPLPNINIARRHLILILHIDNRPMSFPRTEHTAIMIAIAIEVGCALVLVAQDLMDYYCAAYRVGLRHVVLFHWGRLRGYFY